MMHGGEDDDTERNWIRQITPIVTASTVNTTVEEATIIRMVLAGKLPMRLERLIKDVDPMKIKM